MNIIIQIFKIVISFMIQYSFTVYINSKFKMKIDQILNKIFVIRENFK